LGLILQISPGVEIFTGPTAGSILY